MMAWLLKYEGYPSGVVIAILLHALMIYIVMPNKFNPENLVKIEQPSFISATVAKDNPQRTRQLQELERQRQQEQARERQTREEARAAEERQKREQAQVETDKKEAQRKLEADALAKKEAQRKLEADSLAKKERDQAAATEKERQAALAAKVEQDKQETARREVDRQRQAAEAEAAERAVATAAAAQSQALSAENQLIAQYTAIIHDVVSSNWSQPPSTRNGMQVLINIKVVPTGEIVSSVIVKSSGDEIFDRSALQAVDKAGSFPELRDLPIAVFERNFRDFNLLFSPEGLLR